MSSTIEPVFQNAGQALHVAFLMAVLPPTQRVSTQVLIESIREQLGKTERRIASTVNFGGLSPLEVRAQCAMVVAMARDHLPAPEWAAVRCRYGHQLTKAAGVIALAEYLTPLVAIRHDWALRAVIWSLYHRGSQRAADRWSLRTIERETGVSLKALRTASDTVRRHGQGLERRAETTLEAHFRRTGLVPDEETNAHALPA